jgi:hypothetical protein
MKTEVSATSDMLAPTLSDESVSELRKFVQAPLSPVPDESLTILFEAALGDTGGSQAARNFLFWLPGKDDPTGFRGNGGLELRRLDSRHRTAALEVLTWWAGPTKSDEPLYQILRALRERFSPENQTASGTVSC